MSRRHPLIYVLQGPKPWWSPIATGFAGSFILNWIAPRLPPATGEPTAILGFALLGIGFFWILTRLAEYWAYCRIARPDRYETCPICEYDLSGLTEDGSEPDRCPECGEVLAELRRHSRIVTGMHREPKPPRCPKCRYDLTGQPRGEAHEDRCPECGESLTRYRRRDGSLP